MAQLSFYVRGKLSARKSNCAVWVGTGKHLRTAPVCV